VITYPVLWAVKARTKAGNGSLREDNAQEIYYTILNLGVKVKKGAGILWIDLYLILWKN
jgi:hypothetical protein